MIHLSSRLSYIDFFRGIAILAVTEFHLWRYLGRPSYKIWIYDLFAPFERGRYGVDLFFFISGFCMAMTVYKYREIVMTSAFYQSYILKRIIRIVPAYYVAIIVWNILLANGVTPNTRHNVEDNVLHLLFLHNLFPSTLYSVSGVMWSLATEMQFYIIFPLVFVLCLRHLWLMILTFGGLTIYLNFYLIPKIVESGYNAYREVMLNSLINHLILFILGIGGYLYKEKIVKIFRNKVIFWAYVLITLHFLFADRIVVPQGFVNHVVIGAMLGLLMVALSNKNFEPITCRVISRIGLYSYSIYLYNYIFYIHAKPVYTGVAGWIIYNIVVLASGIFMYYAVEKPAQWLKRFNKINDSITEKQSIKNA